MNAATTCRSCSAAVFFARNPASGRNLILNAAPDSGKGTVRVESTPDGTGRIATVLSGADLENARARREALYLSHHATCPASASWRRQAAERRTR